MAQNNVLVIGSGGREHALVWKLCQSKRIGKIFVAPGNGGTAGMEGVVNICIAPTDILGLLVFAQNSNIDLTIVGSDSPLALGIVDSFQARGLRIFGPAKDAARIETSKSWAKNVMTKASIPTASHNVFTDCSQALAFVYTQRFPLVIKADGLALGKGAYVCQSLAEAYSALHKLMIRRVHGDAGKMVIIEEYLAGPELSVHALSDGRNYKMFPPSRDYKRRDQNNTGPNTGGMGAIASLPWVGTAQEEVIENKIIAPVLNTLADANMHFTGCLYPGLVWTATGPRVLEYNARFGDPETQVYMMLLESDLLELLDACVDGTIASHTLTWRRGFAACVALASAGYPYTSAKDIQIWLPPSIPSNAQLFHAGTKWDDGQLVTAGGRVFHATAYGSTLEEAIAVAYDLARSIWYYGIFYRPDIGI